MKFQRTRLDGVWLIELEPHRDERGFFARTFCEREFAAQGLNTRWPQCNITRTLRRGTIRGLHWQSDPKPEIKLVRCAAGAIWDVVVDIRPDTPSSGRWESFELTGENLRQLYIPAGFAHGFQTLTDGCEVHYQMSECYEPSLARGMRWDDPTLKLPWPVLPPQLSERDNGLPPLAGIDREPKPTKTSEA
jgi:dTDP-4-dehydrorhamnose 3,5-epimerase